jgi:hypothetical protein
MFAKTKIVYILVALALLGGGGFAVVKHRDSSAQTDNAAKQKGAPEVAEHSKETANANSGTATSTSTSSNTSISISSDDLTFDQSNGTVKAGATIDTNSKGSCQFNFSSPNTKPVLRTADSQSSGGSQICNVEISEVEFTKLGAWQMAVTFTTDGVSAQGTKDVTIH